jgi:hypothetical protein
MERCTNMTIPLPNQYGNDERLVRAAIINGLPLPSQSVARLEARGIDVWEMENRIRQQFEVRS